MFDPITNAERIEQHIEVLLMGGRMSQDEIEHTLCGRLRQNVRLAIRRMKEQKRIEPRANKLELVK